MESPEDSPRCEVISTKYKKIVERCCQSRGRGDCRGWSGGRSASSEKVMTLHGTMGDGSGQQLAGGVI